MNGKELKRAIIGAAHYARTEPRQPSHDTRAERLSTFVNYLTGAMEVVGDAEIVAALESLRDLPCHS